MHAPSALFAYGAGLTTPRTPLNDAHQVGYFLIIATRKSRDDAGALAHWVALRKARAGLFEGRWLLDSRFDDCLAP